MKFGGPQKRVRGPSPLDPPLHLFLFVVSLELTYILTSIPDWRPLHHPVRVHGFRPVSLSYHVHCPTSHCVVFLNGPTRYNLSSFC